MAVINGTIGNDINPGIQDLVGDDTINALAGDDYIIMAIGGNDQVNGGDGIDDVIYENYTNGLTINMQTGVVTDGLGNTDTLNSVEGLNASYFADNITMANVAFWAFARAGNDIIHMGTNGGTVFAGSGTDTIIGGAGEDMVSYRDDGLDYGIDVDGGGIITHGATINLATGVVVDGWGFTDTLTSIEDAEGTQFADTITGTTGSNYLAGGDGADTINGGVSATVDVYDFLRGGNGNDTLTVVSGTVLGDQGNDRIIAQTSGNTDIDYVETRYDDATTAVVANLTAQARAGLAAGSNAIGFAIADGQGGVDRVSGIHAIDDTSFGDTFIVDASFTNTFGGYMDFYLTAGNDVVKFLAGAGGRVNYNGADGAVLVDLQGGYAHDMDESNLFIGYDTLVGVNDARGTTFNDALYGNAADNKMRGRGGNDVLMGHDGNDTLWGDERDGSNDTHYGNDSIYGEAGNDTLNGGRGADLLDGGTGVDTMRGGGENDTYYVDNAGDQVIEINGKGTDNVQAYVSFNLSGQELENLALRGGTSINGTGNSIANIITGNSGNNIINGLGGADTMSGSTGNDTYYVDNAGDHVIEANGGGTDNVQAYVSFNLSGQELENLALRSTGNINGTGNSIANVITGNSGANVINGLLGNDTLSGSTGNDSFVFTTALNASTNVDRITDFSVVEDTIQVDNAIFAALGANGTLTAAQFVKNTTGLAGDGTDHIIYETDTGWLYYDSNGNAAGGSTHFATLAANLALTNADFVVV
ncbi:beta strand repeat-containing protein [Mesorhizobium kowhaii]|uniref:Calcium-binding protein n=1 Tax=Mesorhizobium kowhaii TaxID=1300272 RepID=A0A2W7CUG7_9HYPH|nr:calcium-binding protein [Mesorhizobium kowhaii]PZV40333.1 hypothetical protein B5V02_01950 [Mesorhizobium kowhaii]